MLLLMMSMMRMLILHEQLLETDAFTQRLLYTDSFTHRCLYTRKLLDTGALTHVKLLYTDVFTCRSLYTSYRQMLLHRCFYAYVPLHTKRFYIENTVTQRRALHTHRSSYMQMLRKNRILQKNRNSISVFDARQAFCAEGFFQYKFGARS